MTGNRIPGTSSVSGSLATSHDAMTDIPLENLPAAYEEARNYSAELYSGS